MLERFAKSSQAVVARAQDQARAQGSATVEAEHLLLALAAEPGGLPGRVLAEAGLDHERLLDALDAEFERTLGAVGVSAGDWPAPAAPFAGRPRFGTSAKTALERSLPIAKARGERSIKPAHVLLAALAAQEGTVPRALRGAGVEPGDLSAATQAAMARAAA